MQISNYDVVNLTKREYSQKFFWQIPLPAPLPAKHLFDTNIIITGFLNINVKRDSAFVKSLPNFHFHTAVSIWLWSAMVLSIQGLHQLTIFLEESYFALYKVIASSFLP